MRSNIALTIGLLLAAFVLMATLSPAASSAQLRYSCCPSPFPCCAQTTEPPPCSVVTVNCAQDPGHRCCGGSGSG
ncbi:uncharacterized protein LOC122267417 isoform X2 [Penaeus japonicus]|uniref:uncharacterized protein LOC122267417 isoform X2 n=1 Tax=Penaeus japonicus TaxID=27405 RepID=UPI001C716E71|nr:uncharacterized protein LOC122267417 isoform X2 [Penaeus japonicus]